MVKEYLEKTRDGFINRRQVILNDVQALENRFKKNIQMIEILEDTNDPTFESFTPREVNSYNRTKIRELEAEQKELEQLISERHTVISEMDERIYEINSVIKVAREDTSNVSEGQIFDDDPEFSIVLLETIEAERQRIARDLHDSTVQNLTSLVHKSELCMKLMEVDQIRCKLELSSMGKILREIINDTRKLIYDLRPMSFDDIGFDVTLERSLDKFKQANNVHIGYTVVGDSYELKSIVALTLLRVVQESCSNSVKHGHASSISVTVQYNPKELVLIIQDNGDGFDVKSIPKTTRKDNSGFGLSMMRERVFLLSGKLTIESNEGKGCLTKVSIPIKKEDN